MGKYTDEEIRAMPKITLKIAADYLGISPIMVSLGMRNNLLPIGFAAKNEDSYRGDGWSYAIVPERLIAYNQGKINEVQVERIEKNLQSIISSFEEMKHDLVFLLKKRRIGGITLFEDLIRPEEPKVSQATDISTEEESDMAFRPTVKLTRQQIYDEVWSSAVSGMALKYDIPYSAMLKQIKDAGIPIPPPGYWTKKEFDKETTITELTGDPNEIISLYKTSAAANKMRNTTLNEPIQESKAPSKPKTPQKHSSQAKPLHTNEQVDLGEPEVIEWGNTKKNIYRRELLYKEIWQYPVTEVAKKYAVSDSTIHKICKALDIPTPPVGYWAKIRAGQKVNIPPLPKSDKNDTITGTRTGNVYSQTAPDQLDFMSEEDQTSLLAVASQIMLAEVDEKQHPKVAAYHKHLRSQLKTKPKELPYPADSVAEETLPRIFRIIDTLVKAAEPMGIEINDNLHFSIGVDAILLRFSEATTEVRHELTREEKMAQLQYEDDMKRRGWGYKPHIRKYDHLYNGRVSVGIGEKRRIRDSNVGLLEDRLGEILIAIFVGINNEKIARLEREETARKKEEERRRKEEFAKRYNEEVAKTLALQNQAEDYAIACKIRALIAAVEAKDPDSQATREWITWVTAKADWFDPTIAADDEFFGTRAHSKSNEKKELRGKSFYFF